MAIKAATPREAIGRVGPRRQVVIPLEILKTLKLREGDFVAFRKQANGVLIERKRLAHPDDVLTPAESALARRGERCNGLLRLNLFIIDATTSAASACAAMSSER